jgi:para-aminobenzoate synthetase/4-amino-4-deoxychorismate lyase
VYEKAREGVPECDDVLLWNADGEVTESTIATIVVELNGKRVTPPVSCGLLPGTYREELLEQGVITESVIRLDDLARHPRIWLVNSVRRWREATLLTTP